MRFRGAIGLVLAALAPMAASAQVLEFPSSAILLAQSETEDQARFAIGPFKDGSVEFATADGTRQSQIWKIREPSLSTAQIAAGFRSQLTENGYNILLDCKDEACGGYDFRYALDLVAEPVMHVDLGDFRYISARGKEPDDYLDVMISRTPTGGIVQLDFLGAAVTAPMMDTAQPDAAVPAMPDPALGTVAAALTTAGRLSLDDLTFATGSSDLSEGVYPSLEQLAAYLLANPDKTVALVGHTDAVGSIAGNIALSKRRAASVRDRLVSVYGVPRAQIEAEGVGYLAPRASNLTEEGRRKNRRVEVIMTSTQ